MVRAIRVIRVRWVDVGSPAELSGPAINQSRQGWSLHRQWDISLRVSALTVIHFYFCYEALLASQFGYHHKDGRRSKVAATPAHMVQ